MDIKRVVVGPIQTNCYLILLNNELAVVDPGDEADKIIKEVEKLGDVGHKYILLTHGHFDHVMAVNDLKKKYSFKVVVSEKDKDIQGLNSDIGVEVSLVKPDILLKEGDELRVGKEKIKALEAPGHTRGSISFLIDNKLFSGDTLFRHSHGRTDLPGGSKEEMSKSLEKLFKLDENIRVYPGHGPETTIEEERKFFKNYHF